MLLFALLIAVILAFAIQAVRAERLLHAAIWLAGASALLATTFYGLGAYQVAVIELSVGAGLVTVLFAFAIGIAGDERIPFGSLIPILVVWGLLLAAMGLLGWFILPADVGAAVAPAAPAAADQELIAATAVESTVQSIIWEQRGMDVLVQVVLIFCGVLGFLGLLGETKSPLQMPVAAEVAAVRDRDLRALEQQVVEQEKELA